MHYYCVVYAYPDNILGLISIIIIVDASLSDILGLASEMLHACLADILGLMSTIVHACLSDIQALSAKSPCL